MALPNGRTSSFLERMRAPNTMGGSSWQYNAPTSAIAPGELDPVDNVMNLIRRERDRDYATQLQGGGGWGGGGGFGGGGRGLRQVGQGLAGNPGGAIKPMDVVYDRGPEQFAEQMKLKKAAIDVDKLKAEALAGLKQGELGIKQQNADSNSARAAIAEFKARNPNAIIRASGSGYIAIDPQTGETTQIAADNMSRQDVLATQNTNALGQIDARNAGAMARQGVAGEQRLGQIAAQNTNALGQIDARAGHATELEGTRQTNRVGLEGVRNTNQLGQIAARGDQQRQTNAVPKLGGESPAEQNMRIRGLMSQHPEWSKYFTQVQGGWVVNPPGEMGEATDTNPDLETWSRINGAVTRPARDINLGVGGVGSAGLGGNPAAGIPVTGSSLAPHVAPPVVKTGPNSYGNPTVPGAIQEKTQIHPTTGARRIVVSRDGGKTWQPK